MDTETQSKPLSKLPTYLRVLDVLATLCRRDRLRCFFSGGGSVLVFLVSIMLVRCLLDYWLHFTWTARAALLLADAVLAGWIFWRFFWKPFKRRLSNHGAALRLQSYAPELRSRLIATVQLVPEVDAGRAPRSLVEQLLMETTVELEKVEWKQAVPLGRSTRWAAGALLLILGFATWAVLQPATSGVLIGRYFLSGQAPILQTQLNVTTGDMKLPKGSDVRLAATAAGEIPKEAVFQVMDTDGALETFTVPADAETPGLFELTVENAQAEFSYRVLAGDATSRLFNVVVLDPPSLRELNFKVDPPAYTGLPSYTTPANAFRLVEGSNISIAGQASEDLESAAVYFYGREQTAGGFELGESVALQLDSEQRALSAEVGGLSPLAGYISLKLVGSNGVESVNNTRYPIQWVMDLEPNIQLTQGPANNSTVAVGRSVSVAGSVEEDYALESVQFCYEVTAADTESPQVIRVPLKISGPESKFDFRFVIGQARSAGVIEIEVDSAKQFSWWIEATDNCGLADGPHVVQSPKSMVRVVTAEEKIAELMGRVRDGMSTIEQVSDRQVEAGKKLKQIIDEE